MIEEIEEDIEAVEAATKVEEVEEKVGEAEVEVGHLQLQNRTIETLKHLAPLHLRTSSSTMRVKKLEVDDKEEEAEEEVEEEEKITSMEMTGLKSKREVQRKPLTSTTRIRSRQTRRISTLEKESKRRLRRSPRTSNMVNRMTCEVHCIPYGEQC